MQENTNRPVPELTVSAALSIAAPPARVWEILTAFDRYTEWHPSLEVLDGVARPGSPIRMRIAAGTPAERSAEGVVVEAAAPAVLTWEGGIPDQLWGRHRFELTPEGTGTRLDNSEVFSGALAEAVLARSRALLEAEFAAGNEALKAFAERTAQDPDGH